MGERLVAADLLSERDLERARVAKEKCLVLGEALVRLGLRGPNVVKFLAEELVPLLLRKITQRAMTIDALRAIPF